MSAALWVLSAPIRMALQRTEMPAAAPVPEPPPLPPEPKGPALSFDGFEPGNIISDEQFFDSDAMSETEIEQFIAKWNEGCRTGADGTPCLADYLEDTPSFPADQYCGGGFAGKQDDTPASIIKKAADSCGINPQVLLTILQKEQGLITASGFRLNADRYAIAMGYACPDGAYCDKDFYGFATQIYFAARQMGLYEQNPYRYMVRPYETIEIPYSPDKACGSEAVYVENLATSNLYNYTPYVPNSAALTREPDQCSAVGNLNFYALFRAWFEAP